MRFIFSFLPLNIIPIGLIFLVNFGLMERFGNFTLIVAAILIFTLSIELMKSSMFALSGAASWLDFFMSLSLLLAVGGYLIYLFAQNKPIDPLFWLGFEAQAMDVIAGFYIAITNAKRDIGIDH